jgi:phthalate 4,5-cis-dihydrodiol dehydrogenase
LKDGRNYGGPDFNPPAAAPGPHLHPHFGLLVASCEKADLRPQPQGVFIDGEDKGWLDGIEPPTRPRAEVMDEVYAAVAEDVPPLHSGAWSLATMEVCLAILQSAAEGREITLRHQIGVPPAAARRVKRK